MAKAAEWLVGAYSVVDLGSRTQELQRYLSPGTRYIPIDCVGDAELSSNSALTREQRRQIIVVDFNQQSLPDVGIVDAAALGVLEYIYEPDVFMWQLRKRYVRVVLSYNVASNTKGAARRLSLGWVNHLSLADCESMFLAERFRIARRDQLNTRQFLWELR